MDTYETLEQEAFEAGVNIYRFDLGNDNTGSPLKGLYMDKNIALDENINSRTEETCILAEELGHHHTAVGNILDSSKSENRKQEYVGRLRAYNRLVGLHGIIDAYRSCCRNRYEFATHLGVTESFLQEALDCYRSKYKNPVEIDNYLIYFEPSLAVIEMYE